MFFSKKRKNTKPKTLAEAEAIVRDIEDRVERKHAIKLARYALDNKAPQGFVRIAIDRLMRVGEKEMAKELACKYDSAIFERDDFFEFVVDDI